MHVAKKGTYHIDIKDNILEVDAHGPFDDDIVEQYNSEVKSIIGNFNKLPWGALVIYHGNVLFSPDFAQLELRVAAHLSKDKTMIKEFQKGLVILQSS